jgi:hypothetical protein
MKGKIPHAEPAQGIDFLLGVTLFGALIPHSFRPKNTTQIGGDLA